MGFADPGNLPIAGKGGKVLDDKNHGSRIPEREEKERRGATWNFSFVLK